MMLLPCQVCVVLGTAPENVVPAETRLRFVCARGHVVEQSVCIGHEIDLRFDVESGALHCMVCHEPPIHECVCLDVTEVPA